MLDSIQRIQFSNQYNNFPYQQAQAFISNGSHPRLSSSSSSVSDKQNNENHANEKFCFSICSFVSLAESQTGSLFTFTSICNMFNIQRRRLYDVINALEAIGCCKKTSVETIIWQGLSFIPERIKYFFSLLNFENPEVDIGILISDDDSISILQLTQSFVLLFIVLQRQILNIKSVAKFLSRKNGRFKTTLCKLYQISHILETLGIFQKSMVPGQIILSKPYYFEYKVQMPTNAFYPMSINDKNPLSIENLLSRPTDPPALTNPLHLTRYIIEKRNKDFELSNTQDNVDIQK